MTVIDMQIAAVDPSTSDSNDGPVEIARGRISDSVAADIFGSVIDECFHLPNVFDPESPPH